MAADLVQSNVATGSGGISCAFPQGNTQNNTLIVVVGEVTTSDTFILSDTQGNTYISLAQIVVTGSSPNIWQVFYCILCNPGSNTISFTCSNIGTSVLYIHEFITMDSKDSSNSGTGVSFSPSSGNVTPSRSLELAFGFVGVSGVGMLGMSLSGGWNTAQSSIASAFASITAWQEINSPTSISATISHGKSSFADWGAQIISFFFPPTPAPTTPPPVGNTFDSLSASAQASFPGERGIKNSLRIKRNW